MPFYGLLGEEEIFGSYTEEHVPFFSPSFIFFFLIKWISGIFYSLRRNSVNTLKVQT